MRFREIRTQEKITDNCIKKKEEEAYKQIKPETDITLDEANSFIESLFKVEEEA